jgi:hypothetical protein
MRMAALGFILLALVFTGCVTRKSAPDRWGLPEIQRIVDSSGAEIREIVAIRIVDKTNLIVTTKEGGALGGRGVRFEIRWQHGTWRIVEMNGFDD